MAIRVKERALPVEEILRPSAASLRRQHVEAVQAIAEQLFPFPTPEFPHFRTFVNEPEVTQRIFTTLGRELTPDIVVLEWPERKPRMVAEVLTPDLLTEGNAREVWLPESRLKDVTFFLYLPAGYLEEGKRLLKAAGIKRKNVQLRTWRRLVGQNRMDVVMLK